ncbi:MAG: hypothetical protein ACI9K2_002825, partial [Myxococcota bacterium]
MRPILALAIVSFLGCGGQENKKGDGDDSGSADTPTPTSPTGTATGATGPGTGGGAGTGGSATGSGTATGGTATGGGDTGDTGTTATTPIGGPCTSTVDVCATGACIVDLLPESITVLGQILYDGVAIVNDGDGDDYKIVFVNEAGFETTLASPGGAGIYEAVVYPGTYDVYFELLDTTGAVATPALGRFVVAEGLDLTTDANVDVLPSPHTVAGSVSYDGDGIPRGDGAVWAVTVHDLTADVWHTFPRAGGTGVYEIGLFGGVYDLYFEILDQGVLPRSVEGAIRVAESVEVVGDLAVDMMVDTVQVQGIVQWNGAPPRDDADGIANIGLYFDDKVTGQRLSLELPDGISFYQARLPAGEYEVWVDLLDALDAVEGPVTGAWQYQETLVVSPPAGALDLDINTVQITGEALYDSSLILGADDSPDWALHFTDVETGAEFTKPFNGGRPTYAANMLPGVYDVDFELLDRSAVLRPIDASGRVASALDLTGTATLDLDLTPSEISGELLYDGALVGRDDAGADYQIWVTNRTTGASVPHLSAGGDATYMVYALDGLYDLDFELVDLSGPVLFPAKGRYAAARRLSVAGDTALDIFPSSVQLSGEVLYDGLPVQVGPEREWQVVLISRDIATVAEYPMDGGPTAFEVTAYPGIWDV